MYALSMGVPSRWSRPSLTRSSRVTNLISHGVWVGGVGGWVVGWADGWMDGLRDGVSKVSISSIDADADIIIGCRLKTPRGHVVNTHMLSNHPQALLIGSHRTNVLS